MLQSLLAKVEINTPKNDSSGALQADFVCSLHLPSPPLGWRKRPRWNEREKRSGRRSGLRGPGPARPGSGIPRAERAGGGAGQRERVSTARTRQRLGKACKSGEKVWGRHTHNTPPHARRGGGKGSGGAPPDTRYSWGGGSESHINKKRTRSWKRRSAEKDEVCACVRACVSWETRLRAEPGGRLHPTVRPGPARSGRTARAVQRPAPSFLWAARGW